MEFFLRDNTFQLFQGWASAPLPMPVGARNRYMPIPVTLRDPNPGFKVTVYLQVQYLETVRLMDRFIGLL